MTTPAPHPVRSPAADLEHPDTRALLAALHEHGWYTYPASDGRVTVVSPDHARSLTLTLASLKPEILTVAIEGDRMPIAWAITYIRGSK